MAAVLGWRDDLDTLEYCALSIILSIAVIGLIGFGLNFTQQGITLMPALESIGLLVFLMSGIGLIRLAVSQKLSIFTRSIYLSLPGYPGKLFSKSITSFLILSVVIAIGVLGYTVTTAKSSEKYTEFYVLGLYGKAFDYPDEFILQDNQVKQVNYGSGTDSIPGNWGKVTVGIVNHQQQKSAYSVRINIDNQASDISYSGNVTQELKPIELSSGARWEGEIGFAPYHTGDNQKVEILLFRDNVAVPDDTLQLWIQARETATAQ